MPTSVRSTFIIGIAGGTAAGKTTLARSIINKMGSGLVSYIEYDWYYKDLSHLSFEDRLTTNFDHPDSLDTNYLIKQLKQILTGKKIAAPQYDFKSYTRVPKAQEIEPRAILIVDGILAFFNPQLRELYDLKVFVDTQVDKRFSRRLKRDVKERGYSVTDIVHRYENTVKPMHDQFVEPCRKFADLIIPGSISKDRAAETVIYEVSVRVRRRLDYYESNEVDREN